tara:strand:+ start:107 stop:280 length:174 start_codon:yes stop_codon:yes gene_type:complete
MDQRIENIINNLYSDDINLRDLIVEYYSKLENITEEGNQDVLIELSKLVEKYAKSNN